MSKDLAGTTYTSPNGQPAQHGTTVTVQTSNGGAPATMVGGYAVVKK